ncbi:MAG: hypothetical protein MJ206_01075 [Bacilli bacterium]|nr:hypothetical protein [Bacilli bacterium]
MKKIVTVISFLPCFLFAFSCGNGQDPGPIDCKDLCFTAVCDYSDGVSIGWKTNSDNLTSQLEKTIQISVDGRDWHTWDGDPDTTDFMFPMKAGEKFYIRNTSKTLSLSQDEYFYFEFKEQGHNDRFWDISGDIRSLINYADEIPEYSFCNLFGFEYTAGEGFNVRDASQLLLPTDKLSKGCYQAMFYGCYDLTKAPSLPATKLADYCYNNMFYGCRSLKVNENGTGTEIFTCPSTDNLTDPVTDMFTGTTGDFTSTPTTGNTYNYY